MTKQMSFWSAEPADGESIAPIAPKPASRASRITLHAGDNRVNLRRMIDEGVRVHSAVTDPPYGMSFMSKAWDATGIERDPEFWRLVWEILLPGGYCFAFSSARTGHWQACAMEMAGFIMHPFKGWVFAQGFPKAHDASKAIDKHLGAKREVVGTDKNFGSTTLADGKNSYGDYAGEWNVTAPATPEAARWDGWAYGTQTQKPALEPIYLGQRPFSEKTGAANLLKHGVGAFNIKHCRVPGQGRPYGNPTTAEGYRLDQRADPWAPNSIGRWPANLIHDGSPEVVALFPAGRSAGLYPSDSEGTGDGPVYPGKRKQGQLYGDSGSAARFFHAFPPDECPTCGQHHNDGNDRCWELDDRWPDTAPPDMDPVIYQAKAGKRDRAGSNHATVKPIALIRYLMRHITPPGGTVLDCFAGSGTTGAAALAEGFDCILMEAEPEYVDFLRQRFDLPEAVR